MKTYWLPVFIFSIFLLPIPVAHAVHVNGYYRSNGTYVQSYERTAPDGNPYNNYSYPGNYNPNTGRITGGNPQTYLNNYYGTSGSYSPSSYSYQSTPTCPANSYYDGISSCKCNFGYLNSGGNCVSANSLCYQQTGYASSYDSTNNTCKCDTGYILNSAGQCTIASSVCEAQIGLMSQYNSLTNKCECMSGYQFNGATCVYKSAYNYPTTSTCPANSSPSLTDSTKCLCNSGYQTNSSKTSCVAISATITGNSMGATNGMAGDGRLNCQSSYGQGAVLVGNLCYCGAGYSWNSAVTKCVSGTNTLTGYLTIGSTGSDVVALKNLLAILHLYSGHVNTVFDQDTANAVQLFQSAHNLPLTGMVDSQTLKVINEMQGGRL